MTVPTSWASRLTSAMAVGGTALSSAEQIAMSAAMAAETAMTNMAMSQIGQEAAIQAAALKLSNDLNDASVSFMKNIGSSVKSAAQ